MNRGFTLIEVLIALAITALVATLSFSSLSAVLSSVESLRGRGERVTGINRAWTIISRDLRHFVPRPVRNEFGRSEPPLWGGEAAGDSLAFTRGGWHNPNQQLRSSLQRVHYRLEDNVLWRDSYAVLDRATDSEPQGARLLEGVQYFEMAFLPRGQTLPNEDIDTRGWPDAWGLDTVGVDAATTALTEPPRALELRLTLEDWGEVRWIYELPGQ